jgi:hypothetical protein
MSLEFVLERKTYVRFDTTINNLNGKHVTTKLLQSAKEDLLESEEPYLEEPAQSILDSFSMNSNSYRKLLETLFPFCNDDDEDFKEASRYQGGKKSYINGDNVLTIQEEENTGFIVLNEFGLRGNESTLKVSFELQLLFEGVCIEIEDKNKSLYEKALQNREVFQLFNEWYKYGPQTQSFYERSYSITFATRGEGLDYDYGLLSFGYTLANITPPPRASEEPRVKHCGSCDFCYYCGGCGYDPPSREDETVVETVLESEIRTKLMDVINQLSGELNLLGSFSEDLHREILSFCSVKDLENLIREFMSRCEPLEKLFVGSNAAYFIRDNNWSTWYGDIIECSIYKRI